MRARRTKPKLLPSERKRRDQRREQMREMRRRAKYGPTGKPAPVVVRRIDESVRMTRADWFGS